MKWWGTDCYTGLYSTLPRSPVSLHADIWIFWLIFWHGSCLWCQMVKESACGGQVQSCGGWPLEKKMANHRICQVKSHAEEPAGQCASEKGGSIISTATHTVCYIFVYDEETDSPQSLTLPPPTPARSCIVGWDRERTSWSQISPSPQHSP